MFFRRYEAFDGKGQCASLRSRRFTLDYAAGRASLLHYRGRLDELPVRVESIGRKGRRRVIATFHGGAF